MLNNFRIVSIEDPCIINEEPYATFRGVRITVEISFGFTKHTYGITLTNDIDPVDYVRIARHYLRKQIEHILNKTNEWELSEDDLKKLTRKPPER